MRLLIANDVDEWMVRKRDIRAWTQRILWFAAQGDLLVVTNPLDEQFVQHVAKLKGFNADSLKVHVLPKGRFDGKIFDHLAMLDESFVSEVAKDVAGITEVFALWPSPHVATFVDRLGLHEKWSGIALFSQGACEMFNSKGNFRNFATSAGVSISNGSVCRSKDDAIAISRALLMKSSAVIVKKAHGGAGAGNHILTLEKDLESDHAGGHYLTILENVEKDIESFWEERWDWSTSFGAYPVVVEEFERDARSIYAEYFCSEYGPTLRAIGELQFINRQLERETFPVTDLEPLERHALTEQSGILANYYWKLGYRGFLSADSVITKYGKVTFTEVNARVTGSTHLYSVLVEQIGGVDRKVTQLTSLPGWEFDGVSSFLSLVEEAGCTFDQRTRKGVVAVTPQVGDGTTGPLIFAVIHEDANEVDSTISCLQDAYLARIL